MDSHSRSDLEGIEAKGRVCTDNGLGTSRAAEGGDNSGITIRHREHAQPFHFATVAEGNKGDHSLRPLTKVNKSWLWP